ncbi:MAG: hypothetical protein HKO79_03725 [Desulfobacterales bacterium]|nr:hypothetical protein [Desulfobacterales bacterium]
MKQKLCKKAVVFFLVVIGFLIFMIPFHASAASGGKIYTAYNIWFEKADRIWSINYKKGAVIPAGTLVRDVKIITTKRRHQAIIFTTVKEKRAFTIFWIKKYHPGKKIQQFKNNMFTSKTFEELTSDMSKEEIAAIKKGKIVMRMSKKAVLACYGPPPEHATFSQEHNVWDYWKSKFVRMRIFFSDSDRVSGYKIGM